jgi:hypothetical protein
MIILIDIIQHAFMAETLNQIEIEVSKHVKGYFAKDATIISDGND